MIQPPKSLEVIIFPYLLTCHFPWHFFTIISFQTWQKPQDALRGLLRPPAGALRRHLRGAPSAAGHRLRDEPRAGAGVSAKQRVPWGVFWFGEGSRELWVWLQVKKQLDTIGIYLDIDESWDLNRIQFWGRNRFAMYSCSGCLNHFCNRHNMGCPTDKDSEHIAGV